MTKKRWTAIAAALAILSGTGIASADTLLTLSGPISGNTIGPQSSSNPCIIAGTTCQQPSGFGYNNFQQTGNITDYVEYSTTPTAQLAQNTPGTPYTVSQLTALGSSAFLVAIDVNTAAGLETLNSFKVLDVTGATPVTLYHYTGPTLIGNVNNNGNGYADWTLGLISFAGLPSTEKILFYADWSGASDGAESFFLIPQVPIPAALPLFATGLAGLGVLGWRKRKKKATA
jgi:hypothetical protein